MRHILAILLLASVPFTAFTAEEAGSVKDSPPGTNVDMPYLMASLTHSDGKLTGYVYISSRLTATSEAFTQTARVKLPFIQDAFVRDLNGCDVAIAADPEQVGLVG